MPTFAGACSRLSQTETRRHDLRRLASDSRFHDRHRSFDPPAWWLPRSSLQRPAHAAATCYRPNRANALPRLRRKSRARAELAAIRNFIFGLSRPFNYRALYAPASAILVAFQSAEFAGAIARFGAKYRSEFRHQYELAILCRRDHDELFKPDGRHHGSFVSLRRVRNSSRGGAHSRLCAATISDDWQFLGRSHPRHALHSAPDLRAGGSLSHFAGRAANLGPID